MQRFRYTQFLCAYERHKVPPTKSTLPKRMPSQESNRSSLHTVLANCPYLLKTSYELFDSLSQIEANNKLQVHRRKNRTAKRIRFLAPSNGNTSFSPKSLSIGLATPCVFRVPTSRKDLHRFPIVSSRLQTSLATNAVYLYSLTTLNFTLSDLRSPLSHQRARRNNPCCHSRFCPRLLRYY